MEPQQRPPLPGPLLPPPSLKLCRTRRRRGRKRRREAVPRRVPSSKHEINFKNQAPKPTKLHRPPLGLGIWIFLGPWSLVFGSFLEITTSSATGPWVPQYCSEPSAGAAHYPACNLQAATPLVQETGSSHF